MGRFLSALIGVALVFALPAVARSKPDFSGTWTMDPARSESAHQDVPIGPVSLVIRQTAFEVSIETRRTESTGSAISSETLTFKLDGTETINAGKSGVPVKVKAHWDGPKLIAETSREMNDATVTTMQIFQLGASGREIAIKKTLSVQHGYQGLGNESSTGRGTDVFVKKDHIL